MKVCNVCNKSKSVNDFYKSNTNTDGLMGKCKECETIRLNNVSYLKSFKEYTNLLEENKILKSKNIFHKKVIDNGRNEINRLNKLLKIKDSIK